MHWARWCDVETTFGSNMQWIFFFKNGSHIVDLKAKRNFFQVNLKITKENSWIAKLVGDVFRYLMDASFITLYIKVTYNLRKHWIFSFKIVYHHPHLQLLPNDIDKLCRGYIKTLLHSFFLI